MLNFPTPLGVRLQQLYAAVGPRTAVLTYTNAQKLAVLVLVHPPRLMFKVFDPDTIHIGGLDRFFRPTNVDFEATIRDPTISYPPDSVYQIDMNRLKSGEDWEAPADPLEWRFTVEFLDMKMSGDGTWSTSFERETTVLDPSVSWQNELYGALIEPLRGQLHELDVEHLVVIPDGGLSLVPFHLLYDENGEFVHERFLVSYTSNSSILWSISGQQVSIPRSVLLVEDPTGSLPSAPEECARIASIFGEPHATVLRGGAVNRSNIARLAPEFDAIHFAAHARFDPDEPDQSGIDLGGDEWLSIADIGSLTLRPGSLIFLSACQTARLRLTGRNDAVGITSAFLSAGASTVVSTFWEVEDLSTMLIASRFYHEYLTRSGSRVASLHRAVDWLRGLSTGSIRELVGVELDSGSASYPFADPYYWGAFALYGDWR
jgi:hypothetical protein